jgi:acyl carrier protein
MKIFDMQTSANIPAHKTENKHRKENRNMLEKIKEIVADQLGIDEDDIKLESNFKEDLEADSLDLFELVMALEEEYGVEIPSEDLEKIATVNDIIEYLKNKGVEA